ncbi:MAG: FtsX-like permease family protein [Roseivirga sp.]|nr:FtsX-like permease family protein [Roseivirga sp.]
MIKNYLITAFRNLLRNKVYAGLNILGLTIGITCFALIALHVENELSYDQFHENESYRFMINEQSADGESRNFGIVTIKSHETISENVAGIEDFTMIRDFDWGPFQVKYKDVELRSRNMIFAEHDFFDYFSFELLQGDKETALSDPKGLIITKSKAIALFGNANPMGETIKFDGNYRLTLQVTGVIEDPVNSHLSFEYIFPFEARDDRGPVVSRNGWSGSMYGFYKFSEQTTPEEVAGRIKDYFLDFYKGQSIIEDLQRESYYFQPIDEIYFTSNNVTFDTGFKKGNKQNVIILGAIGLFTLLIACFNYINSATSRAIKRSKEIGVRKVLGAFRFHLITQFLGEAFVITFIAVLLSVLLTDVTLPLFNDLLGKGLRYDLLENPLYIRGLVAILLGVTVLSGLYPALFMSSFNPSDSIRGRGISGSRGGSLRQVLISLQLFITLVLISSVLLVMKQTNYMNSRDLGFQDKDILIVPNNSGNIRQNQQVFKNELLRSPDILGASLGDDALGFGDTNNSSYLVPEGKPKNEGAITTFFTVGMDFIDLHGIQLLEGRQFDPVLATDSTSIIVNEAFVKAMGLQNPLNEKVKLWGEDSGAFPIIGVVKDFNFQSLHSKVAPALFTVNNGNNIFWSIKIAPDRSKEAIAYAKEAWNEIEPNYPFGYMFLENNLAEFYEQERQLKNATQAFAIICIFIACLGIYGMTTYTIEQKTKEIGIRKVLGASVKQLVSLVNQRFVVLFSIAAALSIPLVYYAISQWLLGYAYHISIGAGSFMLSSLIVFAIVVATVSGQAMRAATANPVKSLQNE